MKPTQIFLIGSMVLLVAGTIRPASAATYTDGAVTFTVTFADPAGNYSTRVDAFWVADAAGNFIKNIRKDAATRQKYLYQWTAARKTTVIDGYSGATISSWAPVTVTWDCRNTNEVVVPDGQYKIYVEFTDRNGQGPWTTNGISFYKGLTNVTATYPNQAYLRNMSLVYSPILIHDIAVTRIAPSLAPAGTRVPVAVTVTNKTSLTETFTVDLTHATSGALIGSQTVSILAGNASATVTFDWDTASLGPGDYILRARASAVPNETALGDNTLSQTITLRTPIRDVAVAEIAAPESVAPGVPADIAVTVTNQGDWSETFTVELIDATDARGIGTNLVLNLAAQAATTTTFAWSTTNASWGMHTLRAIAPAAPGESSTADNARTVLVLVTPPLETNVLVARGSVWRYSDTGLDLSPLPWRELDFYDDSWPAGNAPFGYGESVATTNRYGPDPNNKYPAYYYRVAFHIDVLPTWMRLRLRRDDGAVVYHNGVEIHRANLADGPVDYSSWASIAVEGTNALAWFEINVPVTHAVIGPNLLAVEIHQANAADPDLFFDAELVGIHPITPRVHDVAVLAVEPAAGALVGDRLRLAVTVANHGNTSETFAVYARDTVSSQIVASAVVTNLAVGAQTTVGLDWNTLGASPGSHGIEAFTVLGGVTNVTGTARAQAILTGTGFGRNATGISGSVGGRCAAVAVWDGGLLAGAGATLEVWDCGNPLALARLGQLRMPGLIESIAAAGTFAFVACGSAGVQFVDLADPSSPIHTATYDTSGHAYGLFVSGTLLFVADGTAGLRIVNVATPATPHLVGAWFTGGPARAVAVDGTRAYIVDAEEGLRVLDVSNPAEPLPLGVCAFHAGQSVAVANGFAYVADANNHFFAIDATIPSAPALASSLVLTHGIGQSVVLNGTIAYVPALDAGLLVLNIANPSATVVLRALPAPARGESVGAALAGARLFVANSFAGFQILDVTAPGSPVAQSDWPVAARACDVAIHNSIACVAAGENGLRLYTIADPASPTWIGWLTNALNARCVAIAGNTALVGDGQYGLKVVGLTNPAAPVLLGSWSGAPLASLRNVGWAGAYGVTSDGRTVALFDLSMPHSPSLVATRPTPAFAFDMAVSGSRAYLACGHAGLIVLEIGAGSIAQVGAYDSPGFATGVSVSDSTVYLADGPGGWSVLDVSGASPVLARASLAEGPVADVAVAGLLAALGNGWNRATAMDVTAPLSPVPQHSFNSLVRTMTLAVSDRHLFVAEDEAGLAIGAIPADMDHDGLPDAWELQIVDAIPDDSLRTVEDVNPYDDFDRDGLANAAEFVAGTIPTDSGSRFAAVLPPLSSDAPVVIQWTSVAGRTYAVYKSTNLLSGFTVLQDDIAGTPPLNTWNDPAPGAAAFYIVTVR